MFGWPIRMQHAEIQLDLNMVLGYFMLEVCSRHDGPSKLISMNLEVPKD